MAPTAAVSKASEQAFPSNIFQLTHSFLSGVAEFDPRGDREDVARGADDAANDIGGISIGPDFAKSSACQNHKLPESATVVERAPHDEQETVEVASKGEISDHGQKSQSGLGAAGAALEKGEETAAELGKWSCLGCGKVTFESLAEQRAHYRSDWHRLNVSERLRSDQHLTQDPGFCCTVGGSFTSSSCGCLQIAHSIDKNKSRQWWH